jgi:hypothetical protein
MGTPLTSRHIHAGVPPYTDAIFVKPTIASADERRLCALDHRHPGVGILYPPWGKTGGGSPTNESPRRGKPRWQAHRHHDTWTHTCSVIWLGRMVAHTTLAGAYPFGMRACCTPIQRCDTSNGERHELSTGETRESGVSIMPRGQHLINGGGSCGTTSRPANGMDEGQPSLVGLARQDRTAASQVRHPAPSTRPICRKTFGAGIPRDSL